MIFNYVENILKCAKDGLQKPEYFGYWGSDDMFKTWGFCGVDKNRDSDIREVSNFEVITKDLMSRFPLDFRIENYSHWMVGNVDRLVCRILKQELPFKDEIKKEDITTAFIAAMEWMDQLNDYPIADEGDYAEKQFKEAIETVKYWVDDFNSDLVYKDKLNLESCYERIYFDLVNKGYEFDDYDQVYPTDEQFMRSIYDLELCNAAGYEKWYEFCDEHNIPRPQFTEEEFSKINVNQLELFEKE